MANVIDALNDLVNQAIMHGGDPGGPYFCNEKGLRDAADTMASILGITWKWEGEYDLKEAPVFKGVDVPDELMDAFKYLAASYEVWKRNGNETPLKNALIDAIRFKTDGLSDDDAYRLIRGESINKILFMTDDVSDKEEE